MEFQVAGITFRRDRNKDVALMRPVGSVAFEAEPDNEHDSGAVKIMYKDTHIGYVPRGELQEECLKLKSGMVQDYLYMGDKEKYPPKGWNHNHDGVLSAITIKLGGEEQSGRVIGGRYLRVTTFLGYFNPYGDSDGLINWAYSQADTFDGYKEALNATAEAGTATHDAIENYLRTGERDGLPEGWDAFEKKYEPELLSAEVRFYDNDLMVSGQYDFLGYVTIKGRRELALLDWKSSKKPSIKHKLQVSIYASNVEWDGQKPTHAGVVVWGAENKQRFSVSFLEKPQIIDNYTGMKHIKAAMDAIGLWIPDGKYI